eukprot:TRINITY_DN8507_c0_g1_i1.p1 TRINITY_DN8507_c0_g1~~TRINITY_DN8507_c0_g1_i1.p1  ORF type:complete len:311 (+),score=39.20 TRINITY_DN8507_c0_g1_i1:109-1041(+)
MADAKLRVVQKFVPRLTGELYKGQSGKIAVLGGSFEYTGAPYFSAISAMKVGADLGHIFCQRAAGTAIKSYSPEVIVHPLLPSSPESGEDLEQGEMEKAVEKVTAWLPAITGLVVGPGLGRDKSSTLCAKHVIKAARERGLPIIVDGDGISAVVCQWPDLVHGYEKAVLTPNAPEYKRLCKSVDIEEDASVEALACKFGNVTIVKKGATDKISNGRLSIECTEESGLKRCGGQGDVLTGAIATFLSWQATTKEHKEEEHCDAASGAMLASYAGCVVTRNASYKAFRKVGRSMTTTDVIQQVGPAFSRFFE